MRILAYPIADGVLFVAAYMIFGGIAFETVQAAFKGVDEDVRPYIVLVSFLLFTCRPLVRRVAMDFSGSFGWWGVPYEVVIRLIPNLYALSVMLVWIGLVIGSGFYTFIDSGAYLLVVVGAGVLAVGYRTLHLTFLYMRSLNLI